MCFLLFLFTIELDIQFFIPFQVAVLQMLEKQMGPESFRRVRVLDICIICPPDHFHILDVS